MASIWDGLRNPRREARMAGRNAYASQNASRGPDGTMRGELTGRDLSRDSGAAAEADLQRTFAGREGRVKRFQSEGQEALNTSARAAVDAAMPAFDQRLQGLREDHIRRGVNLGDIGTRDEGSLASAFQRNISNAIAAGSQDMYNTSLDRLYGDLDRRQAGKNAKAAERSAIWSGAGGVIGGLLGGR